MSNLYLSVPFSEKEKAKALGARWDAERHAWYVPPGMNRSLFERWIPAPPAHNVRSPHAYAVAEAPRTCWKCGARTTVCAVLLPPGHETLGESEEPGEARWRRNASHAFLSHIIDLPPHAAARMHAITPQYRVDHSKTTGESYWMNHCERCDAKQGDFALFEEPGGPFFPITVDEGLQIGFHVVNEAFAAAAGGHIVCEEVSHVWPVVA